MRPTLKRVYIVAALLVAGVSAASQRIALDRNVSAVDSNYRFELVKTIPGSGHTAFVLDMTSQSWRTPAEVDRAVWKHWLTIIRPESAKGTTAFLFFITGGPVNDKAPEKADPANVDTALTTNTLVAVLNGVPNEPLTFSGETRKRSEDAIVAYTWDRYLRTGDETWPLRLPMTKAAVRARIRSPRGGDCSDGYRYAESRKIASRLGCAREPDPVLRRLSARRCEAAVLLEVREGRSYSGEDRQARRSDSVGRH